MDLVKNVTARVSSPSGQRYDALLIFGAIAPNPTESPSTEWVPPRPRSRNHADKRRGVPRSLVAAWRAKHRFLIFALDMPGGEHRVPVADECLSDGRIGCERLIRAGFDDDERHAYSMMRSSFGSRKAATPFDITSGLRPSATARRELVISDLDVVAHAHRLDLIALSLVRRRQPPGRCRLVHTLPRFHLSFGVLDKVL